MPRLDPERIRKLEEMRAQSQGESPPDTAGKSIVDGLQVIKDYLGTQARYSETLVQADSAGRLREARAQQANIDSRDLAIEQAEETRLLREEFRQAREESRKDRLVNRLTLLVAVLTLVAAVLALLR
jgi:hypothetical protein